jgi:hypothetical protein
MRCALALLMAVLPTAARGNPIVAMPQGPVADVPPPMPGSRATLWPMVEAEAKRQGVPPDLADAVAIVETGYTPDAVGGSGEIGMMQVMPATAAMLGLPGDAAQLFDPATNIHYGVSYLSRAWAASGGNACRALMKYRAGVGEEFFSPLSIQYCRRAAAWLATIGSPLAANVSTNTPPAPDLPDVPYLGSFAGSHGFAPDLHAIAMIADLPGIVVEGSGHPMRRGAASVIHPSIPTSQAAAPQVPPKPAVRQWRVSVASGAAPRVQAVIDAITVEEEGSDPHIVRMPNR